MMKKNAKTTFKIPRVRVGMHPLCASYHYRPSSQSTKSVACARTALAHGKKPGQDTQSQKRHPSKGSFHTEGVHLPQQNAFESGPISGVGIRNHSLGMCQSSWTWAFN